MSRRTVSTEWTFNVLAGAATVHDGMFLLLKRSPRESFLPSAWGIPAGQVLRDEDPSMACLRELLEETGLHGRMVGLVGYSTFGSERDSTKLHNVQMNFLVRVPGYDVTLNKSSHSEFRWISLDDLGNELLDEFTREIMKSARSYYKEHSYVKEWLH